MAQVPVHKRVLLKLSGEALMGEDAYGINRTIIERIISEIADVVALGVEVAVVISSPITRWAARRRSQRATARLKIHL